MRKVIKKLKKAASTRVLWLGVLFVLQVLVFVHMASFLRLRDSILLELLNFMLALWVVNDKATDTHRLAWVFPVLAFPMVGGLFYLLFGRQKVPKKKNIRWLEFKNETMRANKVSNTFVELSVPNNFARVLSLLKKYSFMPFKGIKTEYYGETDQAFDQIIKALKSAEKYIFLEFFIVDFGEMWDEILAVLKEKAGLGVEVRLIYDDAGCADKLPRRYFAKLRKSGILCNVFNSNVWFLNSYVNNRDHRKLIIVDGKVGFVGGFNIADEYINKKERFGHWKDSGVRIEGEAVQSLTATFLQMWNYDQKFDNSISKYFAADEGAPKAGEPEPGVTQPFCCGPGDCCRLYEYVYINLIYLAQKEVVIFTPYFVPGSEFLDACRVAAKSGVSVKIIYPKIYDKWYINMLSRSYFEQLLKENVEIYEYLPGFTHAKSILIDKEAGVVGSANVDYRSFYSQFEVGVFMFGTKAISQLKEDCKRTLEGCHKITLEECLRPQKLGEKVLVKVFRLFRPLF